jgi:hypothetical protein
MLLLITP